MTAGRIDPVWGDDLMAIADATYEPTHPELLANYRPHPSVRHHFTDQALGALLEDWSANEPIPYLPTDHEVCHGCADLLCGCEKHCEDLNEDVCGHDGRPYCPGCAPRFCSYCRSDQARWDYDADERGEWR